MLKHHKKIIIISIILLLILIPLLAYAQETTTTTSVDLNSVIINEALKTRLELKTYMDNKIKEFQNIFKKDAQSFLDTNFQIFDDRMHSLAQQYLVKLIIALSSSIIFAILFSYFIILMVKKLLRRKTFEERRVINDYLEKLMVRTEIEEQFSNDLKELIILLKKAEISSITEPDIPVPLPPKPIIEEKKELPNITPEEVRELIELWSQKTKRKNLES